MNKDGFFRRGLRRVGGFFSYIRNLARRRITVMLVPHTERKVFNFKVSVIALVLFFVIFTGALGMFFVYSTRITGMALRLNEKRGELQLSEGNLEKILDEIAELRQVSRKFETALDETLEKFNLKENETLTAAAGSGDLAAFYSLEERDAGVLREIKELESLRGYLESSIDSFERMTGIIASQGNLLEEMPTLWPVQSGDGRVTNKFGPTIHPFTGAWYLHKGLDITYGFGKPILAAADGKVVEVGYDALGFGNYMIIRHKYGFQTKYAHMDNVVAKEGAMVSQGQVVGMMGSTGLSTGPHLHFEIRIGSQVVDPERFLNVRGSKE